jgi:hypothetical protein
MTEQIRRLVPTTLSLLLVALLASCGDGTGPAGSGSAQVTMSRSGGSASGAVQVDASLSPPEARAGVVSASQVASVEVTIQRVEVLRAEADTAGADSASAGSGGWVTLQVEGGSQTVDLLGLPSSGDGVTVASGELDPGDYGNVRLFFSEATVTFSEDVTFPGGGQGQAGGQSYEAGTAHELFVPSGAQTGLKVPTASFTVRRHRRDGERARRHRRQHREQRGHRPGAAPDAGAHRPRGGERRRLTRTPAADGSAGSGRGYSAAASRASASWPVASRSTCRARRVTTTTTPIVASSPATWSAVCPQEAAPVAAAASEVPAAPT